jgi:creatinine amidohydrolase
VSIHHLASITWLRFRDLEPRQPIAILPLGAIEAHGPHLPLGTDIVIAEAMARAGGERLSARGFDVIILPTLPIAPAPFAAAFAGTIDTAPAATAALIEGIVRSLSRHGTRATVIANAHHDPAHVAAIRAAVDQIDKEQANRVIFPDLTRRRWAARLTDEFQSGACHAGRYETSVVMAERPQSVVVEAMRTLAANPRSLVASIQRGDRNFAEAGGPEAYFGAPAEATQDEGREIIERLGRIIEDAVVEVMGAHANRQSS